MTRALCVLQSPSALLALCQCQCRISLSLGACSSFGWLVMSRCVFKQAEVFLVSFMLCHVLYSSTRWYVWMTVNSPPVSIAKPAPVATPRSSAPGPWFAVRPTGGSASIIVEAPPSTADHDSHDTTFRGCELTQSNHTLIPRFGTWNKCYITHDRIGFQSTGTM